MGPLHRFASQSRIGAVENRSHFCTLEGKIAVFRQLLIENRSRLVCAAQTAGRWRVSLRRSLSHAVVVAVVVLSGLATVGPVAAQERTTVGGYGELHYTNRTRSGTPGEVNVKRFVLYLAHTFDERITFRSELEVEDAKIEGGEEGGEVALEQAYVDYRTSPALTVRAGLVLVPIGIINETHEPPTFNGVARPPLEQDLLPTTWREIGIGAVGAIPGGAGLNYRVYLVNGLRADGFAAARGIRGGRQEGKEASFANPSVTGRLEWVRPGLRIGGAFWYGGSTNGAPELKDGTFANPVFVLAGDARYDAGPFSARAVLTTVSIGGAGRINATYDQGVGSRLTGGYLEVAYNLLAPLAAASVHDLTPFLRHERYDTQDGVSRGLSADPALARRITTLGMTWKPAYNVAFKADYQVRRNRGGVGEDEVLSLGVGYAF